MDLTYAYAADITKAERDENGDLIVLGKATGPDLDLDGDRCDPAWLKEAMPEWFEWGNIREMHGPVLAGIGLELTQDGDDWHVKSKCIDATAAKKIEDGGYKGYSIGIKNGRREVRDGQNWIVDGEIVEVSYVDRPCNPTAKIAIAKMAGGEWRPEEAEQPKPDLAAELSELKAALAELTKAVTAKPEPPVQKTPEADAGKIVGNPTDAQVSDLVKAAVAEVTKASEERIAALEAELTKVKAQPIPGGPVLTTPGQAPPKKDDSRTRAQQIRKYADGLTDRTIAADYRALADKIERGEA